MPLLHWNRSLLSMALVLAGCTSSPAAAADAGVATTTVPSKTPTPVPASGPALSYLKAVGPERCEWARQPLPSGKPTPLFTFDAACDRTLLSWSPNGKEGLVFSFPKGKGARPGLWRVDFAARSGKPMDLKGLPAKASIQRVGFDAQSRPVALVALESIGNKQVITFEGQRYPVKDPVGTPGLALAYRLEGTDWKRFETKVTSFDEAGDPGLSVLDTSRSMPDQTLTLAESLLGQESSEGAARKLDAALPGQEEPGKWMSLTLPGGAFHYRATMDPTDDSTYPTTPVRFEQEGKLVEPEGLKVTAGTSLELQLQGESLLVFALGETRSAHVFDTRTKKNLVSLEGIESALLWPESARP